MESVQVARALAQPAPQRRSAVGSIRLKLDPMRLGLFLLMIINVSRVHQAIGLIGKMHPAFVLVGFTLAYAVANPRKLASGGLLRTTEARLVVALFLLSCVSTLFGISTGNSGKFLLDNFIKVVIAAFLLLAGIRNLQDLLTLIYAYVVSCGILSYMAIFMFHLSKHGSDAARLSNLYTFDANDIGVVLMVGLPLALLLFQHSTGLRKWISAATMVAIGVTLARSGSRGALVGLIVTGAVLLVTLKTVPVWKRAAFVGVVGIALVVAAPPGYWEQMNTLLGLKQDYNWTSKDGRRQLILRGIVYMENYPLTGLGIHNFQRAECMSDLSDKVRNYVRGTGLRCQPPHNTYIEVGAETGFTGLILFSLIVFGGVWRMRKLRKRIPRAWRRGDREQRFMYDATLFLSVSMVGFAVTSTFVSFAWIDIVYIVAMYMAALTLAVRRRLIHDAAQAAGSGHVSSGAVLASMPAAPTGLPATPALSLPSA
ncbi:MAG TPA: O-antigen ligase family protein [Gemmatimonadales bacterium]|nr:O-antigen ligase family protein [Gemmatimonadales bacterium]